MDTYDTGNPSYWEGRERWREAGSAFQPQHHYGTVACVSYLLWKTEGAFDFRMQESRARKTRQSEDGDWAPCNSMQRSSDCDKLQAKKATSSVEDSWMTWRGFQSIAEKQAQGPPCRAVGPHGLRF